MSKLIGCTYGCGIAKLEKYFILSDSGYECIQCGGKGEPDRSVYLEHQLEQIQILLCNYETLKRNLRDIKYLISGILDECNEHWPSDVSIDDLLKETK